MTKLMANYTYCSDCCSRSSPKLGGAGVLADGFAILCNRSYAPGMSPNAVCAGTCFLAIPGVDNVNAIHCAIAIIVVVGIVGRGIGGIHGFGNQCPGVGIVSVGIVCTVVRHVLAGGVGAKYINGKVKLVP